MRALSIVGKTLSVIGKTLFIGIVIAGTFVMNCIGLLICAIDR